METSLFLRFRSLHSAQRWRGEEFSGFTGISRRCSVDLSRQWVIQGWTWPCQGNRRTKHGQVRLQQGTQSQQCPALCWVRGEFWNSISPHPLVWIPWVMLTRCSIAFLLMKPLGPGVLTALTFKLGMLNKYLTAEIHLQSCALKAST